MGDSPSGPLGSLEPATSAGSVEWRRPEGQAEDRRRRRRSNANRELEGEFEQWVADEEHKLDRLA